MKIAIKDANILIDLEIAGLLELWFQLDYETHVTDLVVGELEEGSHVEALRYIDDGLLQVKHSDPKFLSDTVALKEKAKDRLSLADCSVLLLATQLGAMLLSGDGPLRKAARIRQVEIHGTIWIFDQLIEEGLLSHSIATKKLEDLLAKNRYLPQDVCDERIKRWKHTKRP